MPNGHGWVALGATSYGNVNFEVKAAENQQVARFLQMAWATLKPFSLSNPFRIVMF